MESMENQTNIWEVLETIKIDIKIEENADRSDQIFYQHLHEGMQKNDLDKIYEFMDAVERGCGFSRDEKIFKLMNKAYKENPLRLGELIAARNNLIDYRLLLSHCTSEMIGGLIATETKYTLFYYECAKLLFQRIRVDKGCRMHLVKAIKKIAAHDGELWKRWINENEYHIDWQKSVGEVLDGLSEEALIVYANTIHLDMKNQDNLIQIIPESLQKIPEDHMRHILSIISEDICLRWKSYIQKEKEQKKFHSDIMIPAYTNIILWSMETLMEGKGRWEKEFVNKAQELENDMQEWFENKSQMNSVFFLDLTQIFYLLYLKKNEFPNIKTEAILSAAYKIRMLMKRLNVFWNKSNICKTRVEPLLNLI